MLVYKSSILILLFGQFFVAAQLDIDYLERLNPSTNDEVRMSLFC